jgi:hypothetical protein
MLKLVWCVPVTHGVPWSLTCRASVSYQGFHPKPIGRIDSPCSALRFRVFLGGDSANELEVVK